MVNVSFECLTFLGVSFLEYVDQLFHTAYTQEIKFLNIGTEHSSVVLLTSSSDFGIEGG